MGWSELIGQRLGDDQEYEIVAELGRGGSSRVYRARDHAQERDVAIKVIPSDADDKAGFIKRFEREAQAVETLHHPNIVEVYGKGETEELVYLVMQCVTGGTFRSRMGTRMPVAEAAGAAIQMAHALHHAHQQGIIHRDVKPSNMLVDAENSRRLLLTDFGIAKLLGLRGLTKSGTTIGTPEYMSPEQAEGHEVDHRADVYSLGCVLYEALTGRPPFTGPTPVSVLYQQVHARPPYVRGLNVQAPHELMLVVQRALAKRPDERFQTAEAFAQALYPFTERSSAVYPVLSWPPAEQGNATENGAAAEVDAGGGERPSGERAAAERGLGAEGLDAIFPDDPEAREARINDLAQRSTQPPPPEMPVDIPISQRPTEPPVPADALELPIAERPTLPPFAVPISERNTQPPTRRHKRSTIPVSPLRLPSKPTQPLDLPVGPDGRLDIEAMMAEAERQAAQPDVAGLSAAPPSSPQRQPIVLYTEVEPALGPGPVGTSEAEMAGARRRHDWADAGSGGWRPRRVDADAGGRRLSRAGIALLVIVLLAVLLGVGINTSALGLIRSTASAHATATAPATRAPTATSTSTPSARPTATQNPQSKLDAAAAASFSAIILSAFPDQSCSQANNTTHFAQRTVYVDLCTSSKLLPNPVTIAIRQNGAVVYSVVNNVYLSYPGHYYFGRFAIAPGSYDMWVTMKVQGKTATARDIPFTVG